MNTICLRFVDSCKYVLVVYKLQMFSDIELLRCYTPESGFHTSTKDFVDNHTSAISLTDESSIKVLNNLRKFDTNFKLVEW